MSKGEYKVEYKKPSCQLLKNNELCPQYQNCHICSRANREKNVFDLFHNTMVNCTKSGKQSFTIEVVVKNKTQKLVKSISIKEGLLIGCFKFALKCIKVVQDSHHIEPVDVCSAPFDILEDGELLLPSSFLCPNDEFRIIYELVHIGKCGDFNTICSSVDLSADMVEHIYSKLDLNTDRDNCCESKKPTCCDDMCCDETIINKALGLEACDEVVISSDIKWIFGKCHFSKTICEDGKFELFNFVKKCNNPYQFISFEYKVTGDYQILTAEAITGDGCVIPITDWVTNTMNHTKSGKFTAPIGRFMDFSGDMCRSDYTIHYLKFRFKTNKPISENFSLIDACVPGLN